MQRAQKMSKAEIGLDLLALLKQLDQAVFEAYSWIFQVHQSNVSFLTKASFE